MKDLVILILAGATLVLSLVFQPWCELGFGLDPNEITKVSMLTGPLNAFADAMAPMTGVAEQLKTQVRTKLEQQATLNGVDIAKNADPDWKKDVVAGNYSYALFMAFALVTASIAIILIGREDAEEKLVLPVKK